MADRVDLMDAAMAEAKVSPQDLVIMVNGLIGRYFLSLSFFFKNNLF